MENASRLGLSGSEVQAAAAARLSRHSVRTIPPEQFHEPPPSDRADLAEWSRRREELFQGGTVATLRVEIDVAGGVEAVERSDTVFAVRVVLQQQVVVGDLARVMTIGSRQVAANEPVTTYAHFAQAATWRSSALGTALVEGRVERRSN